MTQQPAPALRIPQVEPEIMDVEGNPATRPQNPARLLNARRREARPRIMPSVLNMEMA